MNRLIFIGLAVLFSIALITLVTFVASKPGPQSTFEMRQEKDTILFAVTPWGEPVKMKQAYRPLLHELGERLGKKFQILVIEDYDSAIENIVDGSIDIAVLPPVSFVVAKGREPGLRYISTLMREQGEKRFATYRSYLVASKEKYAGWQFDDFIKEKKYRFGFVTKKSSSGWAYPMAMMKRRGIDPEKVFKEVLIFENHPALTDAIVRGEIDLGATWEYNLEEARKIHGDLFETVMTVARIPGLVWVASKNIDPSLVEKIRAVQMEINDSPRREEFLAETPDKGWQVLDEAMYDEVREVIKFVGSFE